MRFRFQFWLVWRYVRSGRKLLGGTSFLALLGMVLGVACMVVAMAVVSGFETTLRQSVVDVAGHILLVRRGSAITQPGALAHQVRGISPEVIAWTPFVQAEAVSAHQGKLAGVLVEGLDPDSVDDVLNLRSRVQEGDYSLRYDKRLPEAMIGRGLARKFNLHVGDVFRVVLPRMGKEGTQALASRILRLRVSGILSLGKYEYDERYILTHVRTVQDLIGIREGVSGLRLRLSDESAAPEVSHRLSRELGYPYWSKDWQMVNQNLFRAVKLEKVVIFFVILIMVIAASFNISSTLYVNVLRRYNDISILKALGMKSAELVSVFTLQGLAIGVLGSLFGFLLGLGLCFAFAWVQVHWALLPEDVYKISSFGFDLRFLDMLAVLSISLLVCFLSTLAPALRGARLNPVEGLRYE